MVLARGMRLVVVAVVVGGALAVVLGSVASSLLYGVRPTDPATYASAIGLLATAAFVACWIPARRATRMDPADTLRME